MTTRYILISLISGVLFGVLDGILNANPLAVRLYAVYKPIAKTSANIVAGVMIDVVFGFVLAGLFLLLYPSLPGGAGLVKGLSFGLIAWVLRVLMNAASQWMMFKVPIQTLLYTLCAGLLEMLLLGALYGLALHPAG
ncbi:hypothetical protein EG834_16590 [bacterium]|nr:hypothetical protein [bacterium]